MERCEVHLPVGPMLDHCSAHVLSDLDILQLRKLLERTAQLF